MALFGYAQTVFFFLAEIHDAGTFPVSVVPFALAFVFSWPCEHVKRLLRKKEEEVMNQNKIKPFSLSFSRYNKSVLCPRAHVNQGNCS